jgi:thioredoxin 1
MKQWYYTFIYKVLFFNKKESLYMSNVIEITDENFEIEVLQEEKLTLVDFWATWCGPCRKLAPIIDELSDDFKDKVKFVKIKADENIVTAQKYSVIGVPCLLIFKNGEPVERIVNIVPKSIIATNINKHL